MKSLTMILHTRHPQPQVQRQIKAQLLPPLLPLLQIILCLQRTLSRTNLYTIVIAVLDQLTQPNHSVHTLPCLLQLRLLLN
jgi:hypothetical protein